MLWNSSIAKVGGTTTPAINQVDEVIAMFQRSRQIPQELERELASMIAWLPGIVARLDVQYRFLFISPQIEAISGRKAASYISTSHDQLGDTAVEQARWKAAFDGVLRSRLPRDFEHWMTDQHHDRRFFVTKIAPLFDVQDAVVGFITVSTDYSDRERRAEFSREERTELRRVDDQKNEYLATLAHELRGPLAPISSAVQLMKLMPGEATTIKCREIIERQVSQLAGLIDDLMEIGRINSGKMTLQLAPVSVDMLVRNVTEATQPVCNAKQQTLHVPEVPPDLWIQGDILRLTQLLNNLLTNASKYSGISSVVQLEVVCVAQMVEFRVMDNGIGLSNESIKSIFDMFSQVHATGADARGGLGIGLALARQIALLHHGNIVARSGGKDKGSTFIFSIPLLQEGVVLAPSPVADIVPSIPMKLLVVDDNIDGASTLADMLTALGHQVTKCFDGTSAILLLENEPFDLAFLDLGLPDKSGVEIALTVLKKGMGINVRLIALTGLSRERERFLTKVAGFEEHLIKPIKFDDLLRLVGKAETVRPVR